MEELNESDVQKEARQLAWNHFDLHAKHRVDFFKTYVAFVSIAYAGYGVGLQSQAYWISASLSILAILLSVIFFLFDLRIRQLIKISERYLLDDELRLSQQLNNSNIRLFHKSDMIANIGKSGLRLTYSNLFRWIYSLNIGLTVVLLLVLVAVAGAKK